ncbi:MAG: hypothetical protein RMX65_022815 [Nostoc sp. DedQUE01]|nr:hypothetical protein [Nostoc sp. DedQUE01]
MDNCNCFGFEILDIRERWDEELDYASCPPLLLGYIDETPIYEGDFSILHNQNLEDEELDIPF